MILAGVVCVLTSAVAISLFRRAQSTGGRERLVWLSLDATAAGFGIWATHFIAMLAYAPSVGAGYDFTLTVLSLVFAVLITGAGLAVAERASSPRGAVFGGIVVGLGIAAMHFTGMAALEFSGRIHWAPSAILTAVLLGMVFGSFALFAAARRNDWMSALVATSLLAIAVISTHFTAMSAVTLEPDPTLVSGTAYLSPGSLSLLVAGVAAVILSTCLVAALSDRQAKDKLRQQKRLLDSALENMSQGLCMFEADGRALLFNDRYAKLMGMSAASLKNLSLLDLLRQGKASGELVDDPDELYALIISEIRQGKSTNRIMESTTGRTLRVVEQPMDGGGWIATFEDITQWRKAQEQITHMARHDALTNLPNRTLFREQLELAMRRLSRDERVTVLCLDLDYFKDVNDSLGHPIGDELLVNVAARLTSCMREGDTVSRLGGDEFAIVQAGRDLSASAASAFADRLIEVVSAPYEIQEHQVVIGASVGISVAPDDGATPDQLLKNADMALYRAKADGRGVYRFFEAGMDARAQARRIMELDLRAALLREEFEVYYQPIYDLKADEIICFEALVRWNHPVRGMTLPADFISLAEESGLIVPIGDWVLQTACKDAAGWSRDVGVAVNLSPVQFKNRNLVPSVFAALTASGLAPHRLELEITESVLLQDSEITLASLHKLREFGVKIAMDDFGTGYSSLSYLRSFPFDKIKIDRSFVQELATRGDSMAIVRAVTGLGKSLGISTTAEGVETSEQLALLRSEGCTEVQGYLFNAPQRADAVEKMLSKGRLRVVA
ncbi:bifunctional diguanylate cyclase/phosphodiesterase (plasmid) [Nitrobacteraceae bacterium UC4446_H13]